MWAYRDWVIQTFNSNQPFDQFATWQIAGDLLPNPTKPQRLATAFNRLHNQNEEGGIVEEEYRVAYVADRVNTFGTAFLGLTFECCRCHDHKYDPISQKDYYALFSFFQNIDEAGQISYKGFADSMPVPTMLLTTDEQDRQLEALRAQAAAAEQSLTTARTDASADFTAWLARNLPPRPPPRRSHCRLSARRDRRRRNPRPQRKSRSYHRHPCASAPAANLTPAPPAADAPPPKPKTIIVPKSPTPPPPRVPAKPSKIPSSATPLAALPPRSTAKTVSSFPMSVTSSARMPSPSVSGCSHPPPSPPAAPSSTTPKLPPTPAAAGYEILLEDGLCPSVSTTSGPALR